MYAFLADLTVAVHLVYVGVVIVGLLLILLGILLRWRWIRNPWFRCIHLLMILIVAYEAWREIECPLTGWEAQLRRAAGQETHDISFIGGILDRVLFYDASQSVYLTIGYYAFAGAILATFLIAPPRFRRRHREVPPSGQDLAAHGPA